MRRCEQWYDRQFYRPTQRVLTWCPRPAKWHAVLNDVDVYVCGYHARLIRRKAAMHIEKMP